MINSKKNKKTEAKSPVKKIADKWNETTTIKKWGALSWSTAIVLTLLFIIGTFLTTKDMSTFVIVVSAAWAEVATYNAVYAWKAKCENKLKITYEFIQKVADKYGIEAITPIL